MCKILKMLRNFGLAALCIVSCMTSNVFAGVIINFTESSGDVVATLSGSLSLGNWSGSGSGFPPQTFVGVTDYYGISQWNVFSMFTASQNATYSYACSTVNLWGVAGGPLSFATSSSLSGIKAFEIAEQLSLSRDYVFGTSISGTATWNNKTLAEIGITNQGTYTYIVGSGVNTDTVTFIMGSTPVPEPTSMAIFALGATGIALRRRRKINA